MLGKFTLDNIPPLPRGQAQIEVTLELDVNCILNVSAVEKSTQTTKKITITNEKGRLSQSEIDRLIKEAEANKEVDEKAFLSIEAKNKLEQYYYSIRTSMNDEKLKPQFTYDEISKLSTKVDEILQWISNNPSSTKEEYDSQTKSIESIFNPIMTRVYQATGGQGMPNTGGADSCNPNFNCNGYDFGDGSTTGTKSHYEDVE